MKANYNTFLVMDCKARKPVLVTSSARKATDALKPGYRVEVWNGNELVTRIYAKNRAEMRSYVSAEKEYHAQKQARREHYNRMKENRAR